MNSGASVAIISAVRNGSKSESTKALPRTTRLRASVTMVDTMKIDGTRILVTTDGTMGAAISN